MNTATKGSRLDMWLQKNGYSRTRLPGLFQREVLFNQIKIGSQVGIETPHGQLLTGRATIWNQNQQIWVLNLGGPHGTPGIAGPENTIYVSGARL